MSLDSSRPLVNLCYIRALVYHQETQGEAGSPEDDPSIEEVRI